ncbi:MAG: hypothetical protein LM583_05755 [Desulfurococcaceae archaeon]|nr:hypothetical protein [Desulfurococcaceae archaeon]
MAVEARRKEAREEERLLKILAGGIALATIAVVLQLLLSRLFARPAPTAMPAFDYVIDIYSDKIVITASDGSTTTLNTINDLNDWLYNVRGKRIRMNVHTVIRGEENSLALSSNEYWIFGEWIATYVDIYEPNTTIISFAPLGNDYDNCYVDNWSPFTGEYVDVSGLKLFAIYADLDIENPYSLPPSTYMPVYIVLLSTSYSRLLGTAGNVFVQGEYLSMQYCKLGYTFIDVNTVSLLNCVADNAIVMLKSRTHTILGNVDFSNAIMVLYDIRFAMSANLPAGQSASIDLPLLKPASVRGYDFTVFIEQIGVFNTYTAPDASYYLHYLTPLPSGVTYSIDAPNKRIVIANSTTSTVSVGIYFRIVSL